MNKFEYTEKLNRVIDVIAQLPDDSDIVSVILSDLDEPRYNSVHLSPLKALPEFKHSTQHGLCENTIRHYSVIDGFEVFVLKDKEVTE